MSRLNDRYADFSCRRPPQGVAFSSLPQGSRFEHNGLTYLVTDMEGVAVRPLSGVSHRFGPDDVVRPIPCSQIFDRRIS